MLRGREEVCDVVEARRARELRCDIGERDREDGVDLDLALVHLVAPADLDVGAHPDANAARDFSAADPIAETLREQHGHSLPWGERSAGRPSWTPRLTVARPRGTGGASACGRAELDAETDRGASPGTDGGGARAAGRVGRRGRPERRQPSAARDDRTSPRPWPSFTPHRWPSTGAPGNTGACSRRRDQAGRALECAEPVASDVGEVRRRHVAQLTPVSRVR